MKKLFLFLTITTTLIANAQIQQSALHTEGRKIIDECGNVVIPIGVNLGNMWEYNFGVDDYAEIRKTKANCVRIALTTQYQDWSNDGVWTPLTNAQLDTIIKSCVDNKMMPIVTLHDWTATNQSSAAVSLPLATAWWTNPGRLAILKKYQKYLMLNIANEPENGVNSKASYFQANKTAITVLRNAGLNCPLIIDSYEWGHDVSFVTTYGAQLINYDPLHKIIFSIHAYWPSVWYNNTAISNLAASMYQANVPFMFGEVAAYNGVSTQPINYALVIQKAAQYKFGWQVWWWGFQNPGGNNLLSMTNTGTYAGLTGAGLNMAVTNIYSIKNKAITPLGLLNGGCNTTSIGDVFQQKSLKIYPNPADKYITVESEEHTILTLYDILGKEVCKFEIKVGVQRIDLPSNLHKGMYYLTSEKTYYKLVLDR